MTRFARCAIAAALFLLSPLPAPAAAPPSPLEQAGALYDKGDFKGAIKLLNTVIASDPKNAHALVLRGDAEDNQGDSQAAIIDYNAAIAINPEFEYAYATRCGTQNELGHYRDAITDCTKALTLAHTDDMALRGRSAAYFFLGDYQLSSADAEQAMAIDGANAWNILARCRADVALRHLDEALKACDSFARMRPDDTSGYFYRARIEMLTGKPELAKADFHEALQIDAGDTVVHYWLSVIALGQKSYNESVAEADAYLLKNADDADTLLVRASAELALGKTTEAKYDASTALHQYQIQNDSDGVKTAQNLLDTMAKP